MTTVPASACKSCGANILWVTHHETHATMPLDMIPSAAGRWHIVDQFNLAGDNERLAHHGGEGGHTSHFATCPYADRHRTVREHA